MGLYHSKVSQLYSFLKFDKRKNINIPQTNGKTNKLPTYTPINKFTIR